MTGPGDADARRPLSGATVVVTRAATRSETLVAPLQSLGATVLTYASTQIVERDVAALRDAARQLARYDWVVFTSATAVAMTFEATEAIGITSADWARTKIAVVGSATAHALRERGAEPSLLPERFVAESLMEAFTARDDVRGTRVLYPSAAGARPVLCNGLSALGATVDRIDAYESVATHADVSEVRAALREGRISVVTLTASSAVTAWVQAMAPDHDRAEAVSIGPVTTQAARAAGMRVAAEAMPSTLDGLVAAVVRAVRAQRDRHIHHTPPS